MVVVIHVVVNFADVDIFDVIVCLSVVFYAVVVVVDVELVVVFYVMICVIIGLSLQFVKVIRKSSYQLFKSDRTNLAH